MLKTVVHINFILFGAFGIYLLSHGDIYSLYRGKFYAGACGLCSFNACVASGGWVSMGQGAATAIHPKAEEHPQAYQPATQPRAPPRQAEGTSG